MNPAKLGKMGSRWVLDEFLPPYKPRKSKFRKNEKNARRYYHFMCAIVILDHFLPFYPLNNPKHEDFEKMKENTWRYYHFTHVYHKQQSYDVSFLRYEAWLTEVFAILNVFLPFYPLNNPKNQSLEKLKKTSGDIIILHRCTINDSHMMYGSWDIGCDGQIFLSFWTIFALLPP